MIMQTTEQTTRRRFMRTAALAGPTTAAFTAACGASPEPAAALRTPSRDTKDELIWLTWSSNTGERATAYGNMIKPFNERFPGVTVTQVPPPAGPFGATFEKLVTTIAAGERLDLVGVVPEFVPVYMDRAKALSDLNTWFRRDPAYKAADHVKGAIDGLTWKGKLGAVPVGLSTSIAIYNAELLQRKGIAPPRPTGTSTRSSTSPSASPSPGARRRSGATTTACPTPCASTPTSGPSAGSR